MRPIPETICQPKEPLAAFADSASSRRPDDSRNPACANYLSSPMRSSQNWAGSRVDDAQPRPPKSAGQIVKDEGDGGTKLADFLASQKFI